MRKKLLVLAVLAAATGLLVSAGGGVASAAAKLHCFGVLPGGYGSGAASLMHRAGGAAGNRSYIEYAPGCQGHDEPQILPISSTAGTGQNVTWTVKLPVDGTRQTVDMGPTFWFGAAVHDSVSLASQAFEELQFYPDSTVTQCASNGGFAVNHTPGTWSVCSPVWAVDPSTFTEYAAFNKMLVRSGTTSPLLFHDGDTVTVHYAKGTQSGTPFNITVTDVTTGQSSAVLILTSSTDGALAPAFSANTLANYMKWGAVQDTPLSVSWEIGHPNFYTYPLAPACYPGMFNCFSYNDANGWGHITPLRITSVKFNNATVTPTSFAAVDGQGGSAQDVTYCGTYNAAGSGGSCTFPYYTYNGTDAAVDFGTSYAGTTSAFNTYHQFATVANCTNTFLGQNIYCATTLTPKPPIP